MAALSDEVAAVLASLAAGEDMPALTEYCEKFELDLGHANLAPDASLGVYKVHLTSYLLCERLDDARFLWKRIALVEGRDTNAELCALWAIGKALWAKDPAVASAAMVAHAWTPPVVAGLVARLQREHVARSFAQIGRAYSLIPGEHIARILGARAFLPRAHMSTRKIPPLAPLARAHRRRARAGRDLRRCADGCSD
jgi:hypothetical protein